MTDTRETSWYLGRIVYREGYLSGTSEVYFKPYARVDSRGLPDREEPWSEQDAQALDYPGSHQSEYRGMIQIFGPEGKWFGPEIQEKFQDGQIWIFPMPRSLHSLASYTRTGREHTAEKKIITLQELEGPGCRLFDGQMARVLALLQEKQGQLEQLDAQLASREQRLEELKAQQEALAQALDARLAGHQDAISRAVDQAIDSLWLEKLTARPSRPPLQVMDLEPWQGGNLPAYLIGLIRRARGYRETDILNMLLCFCQGSLTVFSGQPGTGKTSICAILARALGLDFSGGDLGEGQMCRYTQIQVEKGWSTKRDLIGYFNPLSGRFESSGSLLYDVLCHMDQEHRAGMTGEKPPFAVLLDEANLSPLEHYWSDFIGLCDRLADGQSAELTLWENHRLRLTGALRFLATINSDYTTEELSPRILDRAWVIRLPEKEGEKAPGQMDGLRSVAWKDLQAVFAPQGDGAEGFRKAAGYTEVFRCLEELGAGPSRRVQKAMGQYIAAAEGLFSPYAPDPVALAVDYAAAQRLLPKIAVAEDKRNALEGLLQACGDAGLDRCRGILEDMLQKGGSAGYYRYFA